eukprot:UN05736
MGQLFAYPSTEQTPTTEVILPTPNYTEKLAELEQMQIKRSDIISIVDSGKRKYRLKRPFLILLTTKNNLNGIIKEDVEDTKSGNQYKVNIISGATHRIIHSKIIRLVGKECIRKYDSTIVIMNCLANIQKSYYVCRKEFGRDYFARSVNTLRLDISNVSERHQRNRVYFNYDHTIWITDIRLANYKPNIYEENNYFCYSKNLNSIKQIGQK